MKTFFALRMAVLAAAVIVGASAFIIGWRSSKVPWSMVLFVFPLYWAFLLLDRAETRRYNRETDNWHAQLMKLVDAGDLDCDPHVDDFGHEERKAIIEELKKMPPGQRSLRAAILKLWPEAPIE